MNMKYPVLSTIIGCIAALLFFSCTSFQVPGIVDFSFSHTVYGDVEPVISTAFSPDGKTIASAGWDNRLHLWDAAANTEIFNVIAHDDYVLSVVFSRDGQFIATGSRNGQVRIWDTSGNMIKEFMGHSNHVSSLDFSADGKTLASASYDKTIRLWDTVDGKLLKLLTDHTGSIKSVRYSADGLFLVSASIDSSIRIWNAHSGKMEKSITALKEPPYIAGISPDNKLIASYSDLNKLRLWNAKTGQYIPMSFTGFQHSGTVWALIFSRDGKFIITGGVDGLISFWNIEKKNQSCYIKNIGGPVYDLSLSPDGTTLAVASKKGLEIYRLKSIMDKN